MFAGGAPDFQETIASIDRVAQHRGWLRWPAKAEHAFRPCITRQLVGIAPRVSCLACGHADAGPV